MSYRITDKCKGCTLCSKNCPVMAITGQVKQMHTIDPDRCVSCGLCGKLCAFGTIVDDRGAVAVKIPQDQWKKPEIEPALCAACSVCVENCPKECLSISDPRYHGDITMVALLRRPEDCIGCGICADRCPVGAIALI